MTSKLNSDSAIGFLSALHHDATWIGGLLVTDLSGKPVEFHCTAPVKTTQAHQVLYGPTLDSFVLADNIAPKLLKAVKTQPAIVCTDCVEMTASHVEHTSIVFVINQKDEQPSHPVNQESRPVLSEHTAEPEAGENLPANKYSEKQLRRIESLETFSVFQQQLGIMPVESGLKRELVADLKKFAGEIDLSEPFERIHNAIQQSHGIKSQDAA